METRKVTINPPLGYIIDEEKSTPDNIVFKIDTNGKYYIYTEEAFKHNIGKQGLFRGTMSDDGLIFIDGKFINKYWLKEVFKSIGSESDYFYVETQKLPNTWAEFCERNSDCSGEYFIDGCSSTIRTCSHTRDEMNDRNLFVTRQSGEAHLALIQLERLRDCYRGNWIPNWENEKEPKYVIRYRMNKIDKYTVYGNNTFLSFQSERIRDKFLKNFEKLIGDAKTLI